MKRSLLIFIFIFILLPLLSSSEYRSGEVIIQLQKDVKTPENIIKQYQELDVKIIRNLSHRLNIWLASYDNKRIKDNQILSRLKQHPDIKLVQFNHYLELRNTYPDDPMFDQQWNLDNTGQTGGTADADVDAPEAWDLPHSNITALGDTIVVAVVDNGFDLEHEDLNFWKNWHEIPNNGIDDDENGYIDDYDGWNSYQHNGTITCASHGTHVSGIAAAVNNNGIGVAGVNWNVKLLPVQGSSTEEATVVESYGYVYEMKATYNETNGEFGAFVVSTNSSFGVNFGDPQDFPIWACLYDSLGAIGIISAAATMNMNVDVDLEGDMPTACESNYLIAVTNTTHNDTKNNNAAYGAECIDLGAPGTTVLSTDVGDDYDIKTGTSMASPHVAGAVALLYAAAPLNLMELAIQYPDTVALMMKDYILSGTDSLSCLQNITVTGGRLNLYNSLELVMDYNEENENEVGGEITLDTIWEADTLYVIDDITINNGVNLTIMPGVRVQFEDDYKLQIQGSISAIGTATDSIRFTINDTLLNNWQGIRFEQTPVENDSSFFKYCLIENGFADGDSLDGCGGGLMVYNFNKIKLENCKFSDNNAYEYGGGIYLQNSNIIIKNCTISNNLAVSGSNRCGGGLAVILSNPYFVGNQVHNNYGDYAGGGLFLQNSSLNLIENKISNNFAGDLGGGIYANGGYPYLLKNFISSNFAYNGDELNQGGGIFLANTSSIVINNLINNNTSGQGGGFYLDCVEIYFLNNTVGVNSTIGDANAGGGFYCQTDSSEYNFSIYNSIIADNSSDNGSQFYFEDEYSYPDFYYCNLRNGIEAFGYADSSMSYDGIFENNIDCNPYWQGSGFEHPYALMQNSLCINSGDPDTTGIYLPELDLAGNPRIYNGNTVIIDIGAYEYQGEPVAVPEDLISSNSAPVLYRNYPNPFNPTTTISFALPESQKIKLVIYNIKGQLVKILADEYLPSGFIQKEWDGTDLKGKQVNSGIYFYTLYSSKKQITKKMMLLK